MQDHPEERQEPATRLSARLQQAIVDGDVATAQGWTALHHAVDAEWDGYLQTGRGANIEVVERLLDAGANRHVIYRCPSGDQTPGDVARKYAWIQAAELLEA